MASAEYAVLGLTTSASREQVKEAFRKLCLQYHPDKCGPEVRGVAELRFREIKSAYDAILKGQAGYEPPPPGNRPHSRYTRAWHQAHGMDVGGGPIRCGGPYGGYATEADFYRAMFRTSRNNPFLLLMASLVAIPVVSAVVQVTNGNTGWINRFKTEGILMFAPRFKVNGRDTSLNPFSIRSANNMEESYIYKHEKFRHLRQPQTQQQQQSPSEQ